MPKLKKRVVKKFINAYINDTFDNPFIINGMFINPKWSSKKARYAIKCYRRIPIYFMLSMLAKVIISHNNNLFSYPN